MVSYAWAGLGSSFGPLILLMLTWKKVTWQGVIAGLLTGFVSTVIWSEITLLDAVISVRFVSWVLAFLAVWLTSILPSENHETGKGMRLIYDIAIRVYNLAALIISPWNAKAKRWVRGRRGWHEKLQQAFDPGDRVVWFHCASLGEFEQGRPVIEGLKERCPDRKILLTFFSPSGYEKRKDYSGADHVMYLPLDTARNARRLVHSLPLEMVLFIKYEFWFHFLRRLKREGVPVYLASGIFRPGQIFFQMVRRVVPEIPGLLYPYFCAAGGLQEIASGSWFHKNLRCRRYPLRPGEGGGKSEVQSPCPGTVFIGSKCGCGRKHLGSR